MTKIAYLVSDLQAPSHTFVRREIAAVREKGVEICAFTIHGDQKDPGSTTVLGHSPLAYLVAGFLALMAHPIRFAKTWFLSLSHRPAGLRALIWSQFHFIEAIFLARMLEKKGCTHLHSHFANSGATVGLLASRLAGISWSLTLHGISEYDGLAGLTLARKIEAAVFVACASRFMIAQGMRVVDPSEWSKFELVRCPIDRSGFPAPTFAESGRALKALCVGRLSAEKGHSGLFDALASLPENCPEFTVTIVGDGPLRDDLHASVRSLGLAGKVLFRGALSDHETLAVMADCDFLILPSLMEGLPVVLLEARALGKPVIATSIAGIPELVKDGETGLLFAPADWLGLSEAIFQMLTDDELRARLSENALRSFPEEFIAENVAAKMAMKFSQVRSLDSYS